MSRWQTVADGKQRHLRTIGMRSTEVQQGVRDCFIVKLIPDHSSKWG